MKENGDITYLLRSNNKSLRSDLFEAIVGLAKINVIGA